MTTRQRLFFILGFALCLIPTCSLAAAQPPNILVILVDDLGFADVSYYTGKDASSDLNTPEIDALAAQGMRFENFYANSTVCSPTRASFLTGKFPGLVGVPGVVRTNPKNSWGHLLPTVPTLADRLQTGGYYTGLVGKWHLGLESPNLPNERGFDHFKGFLGDMMDDYCTHERDEENYMRDNERVLPPEEPPGRHATELFTDWAIEFIEEQALTEQPFFLYLAYNAPHVPIQPPPCPAPPIKDPGYNDKPTARKELVALIEDLDTHIGRVIDALDTANVKDNTLVIFTSDNGGQQNDKIEDRNDTWANNGPYEGDKGSFYEGGIRVPMVAAWPNNIADGASSNVVALTMDLYPTILNVAGIAYLRDIDGVSLLPIFMDPDDQLPERNLFWGRRTKHGTHHAVRSGDWKLVQPYDYSDTFKLYDLSDDPSDPEKTDVCSENPFKCEELRNLVDEYIALESLIPYRDSKPFGEQAFSVNERIEAEHFDIYISLTPEDGDDTGEGGAYHDSEPDNVLDGEDCRFGEGVDIKASEVASNGYNVGSARAGEWLTYTVEIPVSGLYKLAAGVALPGEGGTFHVEFDNEDKTGPLVIPNTGGWQNWVEVESPMFNLESGTKKMRVILDANNEGGSVVGNFDWFEIVMPFVSIEEAMEFGEVQIDHNWRRVQFEKTFGSPVVVAGPLSYNGTDPSVIRIRDVDTTGFEIRIQEWEYLNIAHPIETASYLVIEEGSYTLDDGSIIQAATRETNAADSFQTISFDKPFNVTPVVMTTISSFNDAATVTGRMRQITTSGFQFRMQEQEKNTQDHGSESLSYIACEPSSGDMGNVTYLVEKTANAVKDSDYTIFFDEPFTSPSAFLADMQTTDGGDTSNVRYLNRNELTVDVWIDEEASRDWETNHTTEVVGFMVFSE